MTALRDCPVCGGSDSVPSVWRGAIPVFQNITYPTEQAARAAPRGAFALATCRTCGFSFNAAFDPERVVYDESYDNHVASSAFGDYYRSLAGMLIERFAIDGGSVYDVGCGKGEFLEVLHGLAPHVEAIGIDPSCTPREEPNFRLIRAHFDASLFSGQPKLILLRHVLEHLPEPVAFLKALCGAMPDAPLFIEVPDLEWTLENDAFWDFCYEHCNYFTLASLASACAEAGFVMEAQGRSFGAQYQWAVCRPGRGTKGPHAPGEAVARVEAYVGRETGKVAALTALAERHGGVALWGMATKGVLLSNMLAEGLVHGGIDMNAGKQGRHVAGSGVRIHAPGWLLGRQGSAVLVMNPNYAAEIAQTARTIGAEVKLESI